MVREGKGAEWVGWEGRGGKGGWRFVEIWVLPSEIGGGIVCSLVFRVLDSFPWNCVSSSGGGGGEGYISGFPGRMLSQPLGFLPI